MRVRTLLALLLIAVSFSIASCKKNPEAHKPVNEEQKLGFTATPRGVYAAIPASPAPPIPGGSVPGSFFLEVPTKAFNQGQQGSCVSCASAMAKSILDHIKNDEPYVSNGIIYSPSFLFNQVHQTSDCNGSYIYSNLNVMKEQGICKLSEMGYFDYSCSLQPNSSQQLLAASHKIDHYFRLDPISVDWVKRFIYAGLPVVIAYHVDNHLYNETTSTSIWSDFGSEYIGAHCSLLYGWDDAKGAFKMLNSWGEYWGDHGSTWIDFDFFENGTAGTHGKVFFEAYILQNPPETQEKPTITTVSVSSVTLTSAKSGGLINSDGNSPITEKGICWSTTPTPTTVNWKTSEGTGNSNFISVLTGLTAHTTYYIRAYATNSVGTAYGEQVQFTTTETTATTVTDKDGNTYHPITIGDQVWLQENLETTKFANGDNIPNFTTQDQRDNGTTPGYWEYGDNPSASNGKNYNWYAINDSRGVCPAGWHIPTDEEWGKLELQLGMDAIELHIFGVRGVSPNVGGSMKLTTIWQLPNQGATNSSGFSGIPMSTLPEGNYYGVMWSATETTATTAISRSLFSSTKGSDRENHQKKWGFQCRCIKN